MPLEHPERSSHIFTLAEAAGIPLRAGEQVVFEDAAYFRFCELYNEWSLTRDEALVTHLSKTPRLFRCYLPYNDRVFWVAYQILWYMDEIILRDPVAYGVAPSVDDSSPEMRTIISLEGAGISGEVKASVSDIEDNKKKLQNILQLLFRFRQAIDSGYLLLAGSALTPRRVGEPPAQVAEILKNPGIVAELDETVRFGLDTRIDDLGQEWNIYEAHLDSGGLFGWKGSQISGPISAPYIRIGEPLPQTTGDELNRLLPQDIWHDIRQRYPVEVQTTLDAVGVASSLNSAVLFDKQVHSSIISAGGSQSLDLSKQTASIKSFNFALPYLESVPPDRLLDIRSHMPEAFLEFRSLIVDIVNRAQKEDPENATEFAKLLADRELLPHIRKLKSELESASRKAKLIGYGVPVISAVGALAGSFYGIDVAAIIAMLMTGPAGSIKAAADLAKERKAAEGNPMYFLWKARQG